MSKYTEYDEGFKDGYRGALERLESVEQRIDALEGRINAEARVKASLNPANM